MKVFSSSLDILWLSSGLESSSSSGIFSFFILRLSTSSWLSQPPSKMASKASLGRCWKNETEEVEEDCC